LKAKLEIVKLATKTGMGKFPQTRGNLQLIKDGRKELGRPQLADVTRTRVEVKPSR
jgi:hypothetical protein